VDATRAAATRSPRAGLASLARRVDGRAILAAALLAYLAALAYPHFTSYAPNWQRVGVFDAPIRFADMRSLTSAWECVRDGQPVLVHNHCDPLGWRPANYPGAWLRLSFLGLGQGDTTALGVAVGLAFLASLFLLAGRLSLLEGVVWSVLAVSPSVMLGVNRGNVDLLLFTLIVVALASLGGRRWARAAACGLIELAAVLKLFPIFAAVAVLQWRRRSALAAFGLLTAGFAVYAFAVRHELETIRRVVPRGVSLSFGAGVVVDALRSAYGLDAPLVRDRPLAIAVIGLAALTAAVAAAGLAARRRPAGPEASTRLPWLWAGGAVLAGTWVFTENSFDYRLSFALLAVPQLLEWARQERPAVPLARTALVLLAAALWLSDPVPIFSSGVTRPWLRAQAHFPWDELLVWALVVYLAAAMLLTRPAWLRRAPAAATA
jgi:Glycosyltransferase family 87